MNDQISEIIMHIYKCKHHSGYSPQCFKKSISENGFHINMSCDGRCPRMNNYSKKHGVSKKMIEDAVKTMIQ